MALDPNPAPGPSPLARRELFDEQRNTPKSQQNESKPTARDYFNAINSASRRSPIEKENIQTAPGPVSPTSSRHSSPPSQPQSPHIAYQERGRQLSTDLTDLVRSKKELGSKSINAIAHETPRDTSSEEHRPRRNGESKFMLQEAPKKKRNSKSDPIPPIRDTSIPATKTKSAPMTASTQVKEQHVVVPSHESPTSSRSEANLSGSPLGTQGSRSYTSTDSPVSHTSPLSTQLKTLPERGDSLAKPSLGKQGVPRREMDVATVTKPANNVSNFESGHETPASAPATTTAQLPANTNVNRGVTRTQDSPSAVSFTDAPPPPLRAPGRERLTHQGSSPSDSFVTPRIPPNPPNTATFKAKTESMKPESPRNGDSPVSPKMRHPLGEGFTMNDDVPHGSNPDGQQEQGGFLRRVSHSVRHARSYSDRGTRLSREQKWPKSPLVGSSSPGLANEVSSPTASSPEELRWYKNESRRDKQKMTEMEQRVVELEAAVEAKTSIKQMNTELREKRSTMIVLDTQKEIVVRELEVLTEHIAAAKRSGDPLDVGNLSNAVVREFAESLQDLKDSFAPQIEELAQLRNDLTEEISNLTQRKEISFQEFEQLSLKNAQLADLNNQLVRQVQELQKAKTGLAPEVSRPPANGLGIYTQGQSSRTNSGMDVRDSRPSFTESTMTGSTVVQESEAEPTTYMTAPQVVNIRKAQPKKFNWKKGGHNVAKGVTKGLKGAFSSDGNRSQREGQYPEGIPYGAMQQQEYPSSSLSRNQSHDPTRPGFVTFFGNQRGRQQPWKNSPNGSMPAINHEGGPGMNLHYSTGVVRCR